MKGKKYSYPEGVFQLFTNASMESELEAEARDGRGCIGVDFPPRRPGSKPESRFGVFSLFTLLRRAESTESGVPGAPVGVPGPPTGFTKFFVQLRWLFNDSWTFTFLLGLSGGLDLSLIPFPFPNDLVGLCTPLRGLKNPAWFPLNPRNTSPLSWLEVLKWKMYQILKST